MIDDIQPFAGLEAVSVHRQPQAVERHRFAVDLHPYEQILPLIGSKEGIAHVAFCYVGAGDVTIMPDPGYQPYLGGTLLAGGIFHGVPRLKGDVGAHLSEAAPRSVVRLLEVEPAVGAVGVWLRKLLAR